MAIYAYLRVFTDEQDLASQKHGILEYANVRRGDFASDLNEECPKVT